MALVVNNQLSIKPLKSMTNRDRSAMASNPECLLNTAFACRKWFLE
jgi:hypothetical protein